MLPHRTELFLFTTRPETVAEATQAGIDAFIVDWERRGKARRQAGADTQINRDTLADLVTVRGTTSAKVLTRVNGYGWWTAREVEDAIDAGTDEILLPMVRSTDDVDRTLDLVDGRCPVGILVETQDAVDIVGDLAARPLARIYVGLNDLRIDRGSADLFEPLVDGTLDEVRAAVRAPQLGVAGLTLPDRGRPVPSRLLAAELARLEAGFTFLRRSFLADTADRPMAPAVAAIRAHLEEMARRPAEAVRRDHDLLTAAVRPMPAAAASS